MNKFSIETYSQKDFSDFQEYIKAAFHPKYILGDEKFVDWQYGNSLYLAKHNEKVIGHFGFRDLPYKVYDKTITIRVLANLLVLEDYRRTGVGALLAKRVLETPNHILVSGYNALSERLLSRLRPKWQDAGNLNRYFSILDNRHAIFGKFNGPVTEIKKFSGQLAEALDIEEAGLLWQRVRNRYPVTVERSADYLSWRFLRHPFFQYQFLSIRENGESAGYLVYRIEESGGFKIARIIDCVAKEGVEGRLFAGLLEQAKSLGAQAADFMFSGSLYGQALIDAGFFDISGTDFEKFPIFFSPLSAKKFYINIAYDFKSPLSDCYLTKADGDQDRPNPH